MNVRHLAFWFVSATIWSALPLHAIDELPLGSSKASTIQAYGAPDQPPIFSGPAFMGPGPKPPAQDPGNCYGYYSLKPPRFYTFKEGLSVAVHYFDLSGRNSNFIAKLLAIHAQNESFYEISPKKLGHDPAGLGIAKAWSCPAKDWTALYRAYKDTSPSLYIYVNSKP